MTVHHSVFWGVKMKRKYVVMIGILLIMLCTFVTYTTGRKLTLKIPVDQAGKDVTAFDVNIDQEDEFVKLDSKLIHDGQMILTLNSVKEGKAYIDITADNYYYSQVVYVHRSGIITEGNFFGSARAGIVFPIAVIMYLVVVLWNVIIQYRKDMHISLYQYENIRNLGWIIYLIAIILGQINFLTSSSPINAVRSLINSASGFAVFALPAAFTVSVLVAVSNVVLMQREGTNWRNMLGLILGVLICAVTLFPLVLSEMLHRTTVVDVHDENGIAMYIEMAVTNSILTAVTYLECILIGTVILSVKSAKKIPAFDKDYIMILGCQIRPDGSLTPLLKGRTDRALEFADMQENNSGKKVIFVPSGGKGDDEAIAEGQAIHYYLLEKGVSEDRILTEDRSENTYENMKNSVELIKEKTSITEPKLAFSTTNYHVFRSGVLAEKQGIHAEGIGSRTKSYFYINAFIREFMATIYSEWKIHIRVILEMVFFIIIAVLAIYFSNNL